MNVPPCVSTCRMLGSIVVLLSCIILFSPIVSSAASLLDAAALEQHLAQTGSARVIASFEVTGYDALLSDSLSQEQARPGFSANNAGPLDQNLAAAISNTAVSVANQVSLGSVQLVRSFSIIPAAVYTVDLAGLQGLASVPQVQTIQLDKARALPTPVNPQPAAPQLQQSTKVIGADALWAKGITGEGWYIAVLDSGIRPTHEFFTGKDIVEACFTTKDPAENPNASLCPNGKDYMFGPGAARHYYNLEGVVSGWDHGTHVAGIAAGHLPSGTLNGVAPDANIIAIQVFSDGFLPDQCDEGLPTCSEAFDSDQMFALEYVYLLRTTYPIAAVNLSLGGGDNSTWCDDAEPLYTKLANVLLAVGIPVAAAAGNGSRCGFVDHPACIRSVVAVSATDNYDVIADFSDYAEGLTTLFAPGVQIVSATADTDTSFEAWDGTSMATPHVAGALALQRQVESFAAAESLVQALEDSAQPVTFDRCIAPEDADLRIQVDEAVNTGAGVPLLPAWGLALNVLLLGLAGVFLRRKRS